MAADTPVIWAPVTNATGMPLEGPWYLVKTPFSGTGSQVEAHWTVYSDSGGTTQVWTSGLSANDDIRKGDDWIEVWPEMMGLAASTNYWIGVLVRSSVPETSSQSTLVKVTTAAARLAWSDWRQSQ